MAEIGSGAVVVPTATVVDSGSVDSGLNKKGLRKGAVGVALACAVVVTCCDWLSSSERPSKTLLLTGLISGHIAPIGWGVATENWQNAFVTTGAVVMLAIGAVQMEKIAEKNFGYPETGRISHDNLLGFVLFSATSLMVFCCSRSWEADESEASSSNGPAEVTVDDGSGSLPELPAESGENLDDDAFLLALEMRIDQERQVSFLSESDGSQV